MLHQFDARFLPPKMAMNPTAFPGSNGTQYPKVSDAPHRPLPRRKRRDSPDGMISNDLSPEMKPPRRKQRITEAKMAAKLRNFHISKQDSKERNGWFFMKRPKETFDEIEARLTDDEEEAEEEAGPSGPRLEIEPELKQLLDVKKQTFSPWLKTPSSAMAVVLWKPSENFVDGIMQKSKRIQEIPPELHNPSNAPNGFCETDPHITYPPSSSSSSDEDSGGETGGGPLIQELNGGLEDYDDMDYEMEEL